MLEGSSRGKACSRLELLNELPAVKSVEEVMGGTMIDYVTAKVEETPIMDVFEYAKKEKPEEADDDDL